MRKLIIVIIVLLIAGMAVSTSAALNPYTTKPADKADTRINVNWSAVKNAVRYDIFRATGSGTASLIKSVLSDFVVGSGYYQDSGLSPETVYNYTIKAYNSQNTIIETSATIAAATVRMTAPEVKSAYYNLIDKTYTVSWTKVSEAATYIDVKKSGTNIPVASFPASNGAGTFTDLSFAGNYAISARDDYGHTSPAISPFNIEAITQPSFSLKILKNKAYLTWSPTKIPYKIERAYLTDNGYSDFESISSYLAAGTGTYIDTLPKPGTYKYKISSAAERYVGFIEEVASMPIAPTGLICNMKSTSAIQLSWTNNVLNQSLLKVYRKISTDTNFTLIDIIPKAQDGFPSAYTDTNTNNDFLPGVTYQYKIVAYESDINNDTSQIVNFVNTKPSAPSDLYITTYPSAKFTLNWKDNSENEQGFRIDRSTNGGAYETIFETQNNVTSYTDINVTLENTYSYRVKAFNLQGTSILSTNDAKAKQGDLLPPVSFSAVASSTSEVIISWTGSTSIGEYRYIIERRVEGSDEWKQINTNLIDKNQNTYNDSGLLPNTKYYYRMCTVNGFERSDVFPTFEIGLDISTFVEEPTQLQIIRQSRKEVNLEWKDNSKTETSYTIERKKDNGEFEFIASVDKNTQLWTDTEILPNIQFTYRIKARSGSNTSVYSNTVISDPLSTNAPTNLKAEIFSGNKIKLTWIDNTIGENGFEIWRKEDQTSEWKLLSDIDSNTWLYYDKTIKSDVLYSYRIRSKLSDYMFTDYSNDASIKLLTAKMVNNVSVVLLSDKTKASVTWNKISSYVGEYVVERKLGDNGSWYQVYKTNSNINTFIDSKLYLNAAYYYRVKSFGTSESSVAYSRETLLETGVLAPEKFKAMYTQNNTIKISWKNNSQTTSNYMLFKSVDGSNYIPINNLSPETETFTDINAPIGSFYNYYIISYSKTGLSKTSEIVTVATAGANVYNDLELVPWAKVAIEFVTSKGYINPISRTLFGTGKNISRGEFIAALVKAFNLYKTPVGSVADVNIKNKYYKEILSAVRVGIVSLNSNKLIYPEKPITREDMSVFLVNALDVAQINLTPANENLLSKFSDQKLVEQSNKLAIAEVVEAKYLRLRKATQLNPKHYATKEEAAYMLYKAVISD